MHDLENLLPHGVAVAETEINVEATSLFHEEELFISGATEKRRQEFALGRMCARRALIQLGIEQCAIPVGSGREPKWPSGTVGSISHCATHCIAAAALTSQFTGIGIDVELNIPLPRGVLPMIAHPTERAWLANIGHEIAWDTLLFSIKECIFKIWYPLTQRWLGFQDVTVSIETRTSAFHAVLLLGHADANGVPLPRRLYGHFTMRHGLLMAAAALPAGPTDGSSSSDRAAYMRNKSQ